MSSKRQIGRSWVFHLQNHGHRTAAKMTSWYMHKLTYSKFKKRWADVFQIYPNAINFNRCRFCPSASLLVFCYSSMTIWSVLKFPEIVYISTLLQFLGHHRLIKNERQTYWTWTYFISQWTCHSPYISKVKVEKLFSIIVVKHQQNIVITNNRNIKTSILLFRPERK